MDANLKILPLITTSLPPLPHLGATVTALFCLIESPESLPLHTSPSSDTRPLDKALFRKSPLHLAADMQQEDADL